MSRVVSQRVYMVYTVQSTKQLEVMEALFLNGTLIHHVLYVHGYEFPGTRPMVSTRFVLYLSMHEVLLYEVSRPTHVGIVSCAMNISCFV